MTQPGADGKVLVAEKPVSGRDVYTLRKDFPALNIEVHGKPLVYLDNAATTQKPKQVIDKIAEYYSYTNANIHRGVHYLSQKATLEFEQARAKTARFINAGSAKEIIFTRGTTESINLVAHSYGARYISEGDEIIISYMEHHSNIVPWQLLCEQKKAVLKVINIDDRGDIDLNHYESLLSPKTKLVCVTHISNALGTVNPVKHMISLAHQAGAHVLVDGAQSIQHQKVDVRELNADFFVFSTHKLYGPTGVGVLFGKEDILNELPPWQGGGDMISSVSFEKTTFNELPHKFEAGTPNIEGVIAHGAAIDYVESVGFEYILRHETMLMDYAAGVLGNISGLRLIGTPKERSSVFSFVLDGIHPHDTGTILDLEGVAIRTGHHCAQPVMKRFNVPATARISFGFYNTKEEVDYFAGAIQKVFEVFK